MEGIRSVTKMNATAVAVADGDGDEQSTASPRRDRTNETQFHRRSRRTQQQSELQYITLFKTTSFCSEQMSPLKRSSHVARSPLFHQHSVSGEPSIQRASLEQDEERSMRLMLERAMGRASSTLSPGHRHFASQQAKELIAEIELLEQEVNNREQQVLSLYRTIFDQCVTSKPSSGQQSSSTSTVPSPSHQHHPKQLSSSSNKKQHHPRTEQKTLKEHLRRQCPSKLSEEMVKCMAGVYCWLCTSGAGADQNNNPLIKKDRSPLLSRSSTNVVLPRRSGGENNVDYWSCKSTVEVCWISTDQRRYSSASYAIDHYRVLVEQLEAVTVTQMETNAQIAFWINVYNSLVMHAYLAYGIPNSSLKRLALFHKAAYNVGGHIVSASTIEQSIFCFRSPRVGKVHYMSNLQLINY
ncbi:hypothetical protein LINPERPRIM_LOCUS36105 [Linum perenne]